MKPFQHFQNHNTQFHYDNALILARMCQLSYENKKESYIKNHLGFSKSVLISRTSIPSDTQVIVSSTANLVVVSFRGSEGENTEAVKDWLLTNLNFQPILLPDLGFFVRIHKGFWKASEVIQQPLYTAIYQQGGFSGKDLWITGHSLGGALANICAFWLRNLDKKVAGVYTFGAPKPGNWSFKKRYENYFDISCHRMQNKGDIVYRLPSVLDFFLLPGHRKIIYRAVGKAKYLGWAGKNGHGIDSYIDKLSKRASHELNQALFA